MLSLQPLLARLTDKPAGFPLPWFRQVGGAAQYAMIRPDALPLPACWIVRAADRVRHAGERAEDLRLAFDVVIAVQNVRAAEDADEVLLAYRQQVKTLLLGWEMEWDTHPIQWEGGHVLEYTDGDLYWADRYALSTLIDNFHPDPPNFSGIQYTSTLPE